MGQLVKEGVIPALTWVELSGYIYVFYTCSAINLLPEYKSNLSNEGEVEDCAQDEEDGERVSEELQ